MSERVKRSLPYLQVLAEATPKLRKILVKNVPESVITAICECCLNTLKGVIPLTPHQKRRLAPYKTQLRALANRKVSRKRKKTYLTQRRSLSIVYFNARFGHAKELVLGMKHSKKMVLIPEEALQRYEQRQRLETSPLMGTTMHKDTQISDILQRDDVTDDEKQKLFNTYFERYLELRRQKETPIMKEEQQVEPQLSDADVVESIPRTMRSRATALLSHLKGKPDVIRWDKTGQVKIQGETISGSNISDLVSDAIRSRKDFNPAGAKEFFQALSKLNVPKDLVRNQNRWKQLNECRPLPGP